MVSIRRNSRRFGAAAGFLAVAAFVAASLPGVAGAAGGGVGLGTATPFAVLAGAGVTNTGPSVLNGDLGTCPTPAITGFPPGVVNGTTHANDAVACGAQDDATTAYNVAAGRAPTKTYGGPTELGGQTLVGGVYKTPTSFATTGTLTLDGQNDPGSTFVFQAGSTVITATGSGVSLINGAQACNVFWQVGSSGTLGVNSRFIGTMIALSSIGAKTSAVVQGRLLARNGSVTLDTNRISPSSCAPAATTSTTGASTTTGGPTTTATTGGPTTTATTGGPTTTATTGGPTTTATTGGPTTTATTGGPTTTATTVRPTTTSTSPTTFPPVNPAITSTTVRPTTTSPAGVNTTTTTTIVQNAAAPGAGHASSSTTAVANTSSVAGRQPLTPQTAGELPRTGSVPPWQPVVGLSLLGFGVALWFASRRPATTV